MSTKYKCSMQDGAFVITVPFVARDCYICGTSMPAPAVPSEIDSSTPFWQLEHSHTASGWAWINWFQSYVCPSCAAPMIEADRKAEMVKGDALERLIDRATAERTRRGLAVPERTRSR